MKPSSQSGAAASTEVPFLPLRSRSSCREPTYPGRFRVVLRLTLPLAWWVRIRWVPSLSLSASSAVSYVVFFI